MSICVKQKYYQALYYTMVLILIFRTDVACPVICMVLVCRFELRLPVPQTGVLPLHQDRYMYGTAEGLEPLSLVLGTSILAKLNYHRVYGGAAASRTRTTKRQDTLAGC